jgi:Fe-S-cluster-containing hydrogenase component 2
MSRADGALSAQEVMNCPGWPGEEWLERKRVAVLECVEDIPCNPCEVACPTGAIAIGTPITNLPRISGDKCTGCNLCVAVCPGLAIFVVQKNFAEGLASVSLPYELLPLPGEGDEVRALDRAGGFLCMARVVKVQKARKFDRTNVVTVSVERRYFNEVRSLEAHRNG